MKHPKFTYEACDRMWRNMLATYHSIKQKSSSLGRVVKGVSVFMLLLVIIDVGA